MSKAWIALKETAKELSKDKVFWAEAALAFGPWAANTYYQINYGQSPIPYTEQALHTFRGPVCARIATTFMKHYKGRELTTAENIGYSMLGGATGGLLGAARERITDMIPYLEKWTPGFDALETARDTAYTAAGGVLDVAFHKKKAIKACDVKQKK